MHKKLNDDWPIKYDKNILYWQINEGKKVTVLLLNECDNDVYILLTMSYLANC